LKDEYSQYQKIFIGILGSDILKNWFERRGDLYQGYYIGVDKKIICSAPIPSKIFEDKSMIQQIERFVDDLFNCPEKDSSFFKETLNTLNDRVESILSKIAELKN
jgi:hypothetical protein